MASAKLDVSPGVTGMELELVFIKNGVSKKITDGSDGSHILVLQAQ